MEEKKLIEVNPQICFGKPVFAGTRIPLYMVLELIASGKTAKEILKNYYPSLSKDHIKTAVAYAAKLLQNEEVVLTKRFPHAISL